MAVVLPILEYEEKIVETVSSNSVAVIIGETGSGKSTQLSQILDRHGYTTNGIIAITQPRRVAAVSVSRRVAQELGVVLGEEVGYAIRFEDRTSDKTRIKYLTDGCLLRESLSNPELTQYSVIILDEAHERSLNTDILLGLMKRLIKIRASNLKVLITSATLDGLKVSEFFSGCPVLNVPGTLFPVEKFYSTELPKNFLESTLKTALDIHTKEPPGDVLIFMTGKDDIDKMVSKLEEKIQNLEQGTVMDAVVLPLHGSLPPEMQVRVFSEAPPNCRRFIVATNIAETSLTVDGVVYVIDSGFVKQKQYNPSTGMYSLDVVQISRVQADQRAGRAGRTRPGKCYRLYPLLVYNEDLLDATIPEIQRSSLASSVLYLKSLNLHDIDILQFDFLDPPSRKDIEKFLHSTDLDAAIPEFQRSSLASSVLYLKSLNLHDIDILQFDFLDPPSRKDMYIINSGCASRSVLCNNIIGFTYFGEKFLHSTDLDAAIPEFQRSSLASSVLYLKSLNLHDIDILQFDFLHPPSCESLEDALRQLYLIDAIDENGKITDIGRTMAELPLEPSLSRTLIEANELGCLSQALTVAATLSAEITLRRNPVKGKEMKRKREYEKLPDGSGWGDHIQLLQIYESWDQVNYDPNWCSDHDLQIRSMRFSKDVRKQLCQIIQKIAKGPMDVESSLKQRRKEKNYGKLRRALCTGYGNQLAERMMHHNGYHTVGYRSQLVQVHPSSVLEGDQDGQLPDYVVYHELINTSRPFMRNVCAVEMKWVLPILKKLEKLDINRLSGGSSNVTKAQEVIENNTDLPKVETENKQSNVDNKIQAARDRYLSRKGKK